MAMNEHQPSRFKVLPQEALGDQYLAQLRHLKRLRVKHDGELSDFGKHHIDSLIVITLGDCIRAGKIEEARAILKDPIIPDHLRSSQSL